MVTTPSPQSFCLTLSENDALGTNSQTISPTTTDIETAGLEPSASGHDPYQHRNHSAISNLSTSGHEVSSAMCSSISSRSISVGSAMVHDYSDPNSMQITTSVHVVANDLICLVSKEVALLEESQQARLNTSILQATKKGSFQTRPVTQPATNTLSSLHCRICRIDPCVDVAATFCGHIFCSE